MKILIIIFTLILFSTGRLSAQTIITAKDAASHIGETVTICDRVFRENNKAYSVGLYLGDSAGHYIVISIRFKPRFLQTIGSDYFNFKGKKICVTGVVKKGPYMKINDPAQIKPYPADQDEKAGN